MPKIILKKIPQNQVFLCKKILIGFNSDGEAQPKISRKKLSKAFNTKSGKKDKVPKKDISMKGKNKNFFLT